METTGELCEIHKTVEWKIKNFLLLKDVFEDGYRSPRFSFCGVSWVISIYPYGQKSNETGGNIALFLTPILLPKPITIDFSFSFKTVEEKCDFKMLTHLFDKEQSGYGLRKTVSRSNLIKRKSVLLPSDALTVICTLKNNESNVINEKTFFHASVQTEKGTEIWKLQEHLREILLSGDASDVILKVKDQEFKSHRCILAARSPVFSAMMKNEMKENATSIVDIQDVDPNTFSDFLGYLYSSSKEYITLEKATKLYTVADKYQVEVLKENCLDYMLMKVCIENFCDVFMLSVQHNEEKLKESCIEYFGEHLLDIIKTCKWQSFLCENPIICNELLIKHMELN